MLYLWRADAFIYRLWKNVYDRWITSNFPCKWHRTASTTSGWKSSPAKIFHRKLLWRTAIKIHRERRRRRRQQDLQEWHRLAQRRKRRLHSDHKHIQKGSDKPQLHCKGKLVKRENTDCRRLQERQDWIRQRSKSHLWCRYGYFLESPNTDYLQHYLYVGISYKFTLARVFVSHACTQITLNTAINDLVFFTVIIQC